MPVKQLRTRDVTEVRLMIPSDTTRVLTRLANRRGAGVHDMIRDAIQQFIHQEVAEEIAADMRAMR